MKTGYETSVMYEGAKATLVAGRSPAGQRRPQIDLAFSRDTPFRRANSVVYSLAATVEFESPDDAPWVVVVDIRARRIYLELVEGTREEERHGLDKLWAVFEGYACRGTVA